MVKMDYRDLCGFVRPRDVAPGSPSSPSDFVDSSENEMDPGDDGATPRSDGRGSDGNGDRSENTSSRQRRLMPSSPGDDGGSGTSALPPSSGALDLEALPTPNQARLLSLVPTDSTIIMEGELLDDEDEPGTRRPASLVDNSGLDTSASARRSTSVNNNGPRPSNRVSTTTSNLDLVLVPSRSQGSSGGGNGRRRNASNYQVHQRGEHRWRQGPRNNRHFEVGGPSNWHPWHSYNIQIPPQQGPELPYYLFNSHQAQAPDYGYSYPPNMNIPGFFQGRMFPPNYGYGYGYSTPPPNIYVAFEATSDLESPPLEVFLPRRSSGQYPPRGVTIRAPPTSTGDAPPQPEQPVGSRVTITAPPASEAPSRQPEPTPSEQTVLPSTVTINALPVPTGEGTSSSPPKQPEPEATPLAPNPEQPAALPVPPSPVPMLDPSRQMFMWNQTEAVLFEMLYGPRPTRRLPVFQGICPDDDEGTSEPPPPPTTSQPPSPPPPPPPPSPPRSP